MVRLNRKGRAERRPANDFAGNCSYSAVYTQAIAVRFRSSAVWRSAYFTFSTNLAANGAKSALEKSPFSVQPRRTGGNENPDASLHVGNFDSSMNALASRRVHPSVLTGDS